MGTAVGFTLSLDDAKIEAGRKAADRSARAAAKAYADSVASATAE
ncbi:MAG: hypothetical protein ACLR8Y_13750 [Alistipes indistinctus]